MTTTAELPAVSEESPAHVPSPRQTSFGMVLQSWQAYVQICESLAKSGKCNGMRTKESILAVALQGAELGFPPMTSVNLIHPIEGKLTLSVHAAKALVLRDLPGSKFETQEGDDFCEVTLSAPGRETYTARYTLADAKKAGLVKPKSNWEKSPADMLYSKATLRACRRVAPDILAGLYAPEELGVDPNVIDIEPSQPVAIEVDAKPSSNGHTEAAEKPKAEATKQAATNRIASEPASKPAEASPAKPDKPAKVQSANTAQLLALRNLKTELAIGDQQWLSLVKTFDVDSARKLDFDQAQKLIGILQERKKRDIDTEETPEETKAKN